MLAGWPKKEQKEGTVDKKLVYNVKGAMSRLNGLKSLAKLVNFVVCNPCQSSPSLTILVPLWFVIISLVFFHLCKTLFSGFFHLNVNLSMVKIPQNIVREPLQ